MVGVRIALAAGVAALALSACDNGPSAVAEHQAAGTQMAVPQSREDGERSYGAREEARVDHRNDPVKQIDGKPMWSASRRYSAEANAERAFERNGEAFGASSVDQFVKKAHAFVEDPPRGTLTLTRTNGDTLFYDPKGNVFAIATKDGAPRTMFKPDEGMAYWEEVKAREAKRQAGRQTARRDRQDDDA